MEERNYTVYRHIAPNGKMYVGITSQKPEKRWNGGRGYGYNTYFAHAIQKYGWDNFEHEIIEEHLTKEQAELKEVELIKRWDLTNRDRGYNLSHGGDAIGKHSEESKRKMSESQRGKVISQETREKIAKANLGKTHTAEHKAYMSKRHSGENNPMYGKCGELSPSYGKKRSNETRAKISQKAHKRSIVQLDKDTYSLLNIFSSTLEAERATGAYHSFISKCCKGKINIVKGYRWKYYDDYINEEERRMPFDRRN